MLIIVVSYQTVAHAPVQKNDIENDQQHPKQPHILRNNGQQMFISRIDVPGHQGYNLCKQYIMSGEEAQLWIEALPDYSSHTLKKLQQLNPEEYTNTETYISIFFLLDDTEFNKWNTTPTPPTKLNLIAACVKVVNVHNNGNKWGFIGDWYFRETMSSEVKELFIQFALYYTNTFLVEPTVPEYMQLFTISITEVEVYTFKNALKIFTAENYISYNEYVDRDNIKEKFDLNERFLLHLNVNVSQPLIMPTFEEHDATHMQQMLQKLKEGKELEIEDIDKKTAIFVFETELEYRQQHKKMRLKDILTHLQKSDSRFDKVNYLTKVRRVLAMLWHPEKTQGNKTLSDMMSLVWKMNIFL